MSRNNPKINLPIFGDVDFEELHNSEYKYLLIKEDYKAVNNEQTLKLFLKQIDKKSILKVSELLEGLEIIHQECKRNYIADFTNEDQIDYITRIYSQALTESECNSINQKLTPEQKLLAAFMASGVIIYEKQEGFVVELKYTFGYELQLTYNANENLKLVSCIMEPGSSIGMKQFRDFVSKFEEHDVSETCSRFLPDWWNHPVKSYYIYLMIKRLKCVASI
jgi:hypothetical protein